MATPAPPIVYTSHLNKDRKLLHYFQAIDDQEFYNNNWWNGEVLKKKFISQSSFTQDLKQVEMEDITVTSLALSITNSSPEIIKLVNAAGKVFGKLHYAATAASFDLGNEAEDKIRILDPNLTNTLATSTTTSSSVTSSVTTSTSQPNSNLHYVEIHYKKPEAKDYQATDKISWARNDANGQEFLQVDPSNQEQIRMAIAIAKAKGWKQVVVTENFKLDKESFKRLIDACDPQKIDLVLTEQVLKTTKNIGEDLVTEYNQKFSKSVKFAATTPAAVLQHSTATSSSTHVSTNLLEPPIGEESYDEDAEETDTTTEQKHLTQPQTSQGMFGAHTPLSIPSTLQMPTTQSTSSASSSPTLTATEPLFSDNNPMNLSTLYTFKPTTTDTATSAEFKTASSSSQGTDTQTLFNFTSFSSSSNNNVTASSFHPLDTFSTTNTSETQAAPLTQPSVISSTMPTATPLLLHLSNPVTNYSSSSSSFSSSSNVLFPSTIQNNTSAALMMTPIMGSSISLSSSNTFMPYYFSAAAMNTSFHYPPATVSITKPTAMQEVPVTKPSSTSLTMPTATSLLSSAHIMTTFAATSSTPTTSPTLLPSISLTGTGSETLNATSISSTKSISSKSKPGKPASSSEPEKSSTNLAKNPIS